MLQNLFKETQNSYKKMQNYLKKTKQNKAPKIQRTFQLWVKYRKRRVRAFVCSQSSPNPLWIGCYLSAHDYSLF